MLAKERRLRRPRDIERVFKKGVRGQADGLVIHAVQNRLTSSRAVVIAGKKVSKKAVTRNLIRRRISDILATAWPQITAGYDIAVYVRTDVSEVPAAELRRRVEAGLTKAGVIGPKRQGAGKMKDSHV